MFASLCELLQKDNLDEILQDHASIVDSLVSTVEHSKFFKELQCTFTQPTVISFSNGHKLSNPDIANEIKKRDSDKKLDGQKNEDSSHHQKEKIACVIM